MPSYPHRFQPGDTVTIRAWDDILSQYGSFSGELGIKTPYIIFSDSMKQFCGHSYIVKEVYNTSDRRMYSFYGFYYIFPICALASYSPSLQSIPISSVSFDSLIQPLITP